MLLLFFFNTVPAPPTNVQVIEEIMRGAEEITVLLAWTPPQSPGINGIVDNYTIFVSPRPPQQPAIMTVLNNSMSIAFAINTEYNISVVTVNCITESRPATSRIIYSGMLITHHQKGPICSFYFLSKTCTAKKWNFSIMHL